jgi:hypothetical protein
MKVLFSATDESIYVEVATVGHDETAHAESTLLTPEVKAEVKKWAVNLKPKQIRVKLLVGF